MRPLAYSLFLLLTLTATAQSGTLGWFTNLEGSKVVPPSPTSYNGIGYFGLQGATLTCTLYCTVNYGTANIRVGAPGSNGPVIGTVPKKTVGSWVGTITLNAANQANLEAGLLYAEITGLLVPDTLRGQLTPSYITSGTGCPAAVGIPSFSSTGVARIGSTIFMQASKGVPNGVGLLFLSAATAEIPLPGGCTFLVDPTAPIMVVIPFGATGSWSSGSVTVPASAPVEVPIHFQLLVPDPGAANGMFGASPRLTMNVFAY